MTAMLDPWFVSGFCESAAAFTFSRNSQSSVALYFAVKAKQGDAELITQLKNFFSAGRVYQVRGRSKQSPAERASPTLYYRISRAQELANVIDHFDRYPLKGKKQKAYLVWREIYSLKEQQKKSLYPKIWQLVTNLSRLSAPSQVGA
jgi:hypothetical protein